MFGLGTWINTGAIVLGGILGQCMGGFFREKWQETLCKACGVSTLFLAVAGAMEKMLTVNTGDGAFWLSSGKSLLVVLCITLGGLLGELLDIEGLFHRFGEWLKQKTGNQEDRRFLDGFVNASFTVCIGAMAILGAIQDGVYGDYSILATKSVLDFVIVLVMTCSLGKGCIFSAIPVLVLQGSVTAAARLLVPIMTEAALANLSLVGSVLIFCVGINLVFDKTIRVANLLPAVVLAVVAAFLPLPL